MYLNNIKTGNRKQNINSMLQKFQRLNQTETRNFYVPMQLLIILLNDTEQHSIYRSNVFFNTTKDFKTLVNQSIQKSRTAMFLCRSR